MRILLCLAAALFLFAGPASLAHADEADFKTHVLDPVSTSFPTNPITTTVFSVQFTGCQAGELPGGMTADGCFAAVNRTGLNWTELQFVFANTAALGGQPVSCALAPSDNIFLQPTCDLDPASTHYTLDFASGRLENNALFFVTEDGVPFADFPTGTATVLATSGGAAAPEPASFVFLATGALLLGVFAFGRTS